MDHSKCQGRPCAADYVAEETVHVQEGCWCEWIQVKAEELVRCWIVDRF